MSPELKAELDAKIASVVFPGWNYTADDKVTHSMTWDEGYHYSSYTMQDPTMRLEFYIESRTGGRCREFYIDEDAARVWTEIMA